MKLTKMDRELFVDAVLEDVPEIDACCGQRRDRVDERWLAKGGN